MRPFDLSPLYRTTVGFDRLLDRVEDAARADWPPYDIEKLDASRYRITMALAGFRPEDIDLTQTGPTLVVTGRRAAERDDGQMLHRGIALRPFRQSFSLADHVRVAAARLDAGLLSIELVQEVPEQLKPRRIPIGQAAASTGQDNGSAALSARPAAEARAA